MAVAMMASTSMIRSRATEYSPGLMGGSMKDTGTMASSMAKASTTHRREKSRKVSGKKGSAWLGLNNERLRQSLCT